MPQGYMCSNIPGDVQTNQPGVYRCPKCSSRRFQMGSIQGTRLRVNTTSKDFEDSVYILENVDDFEEQMKESHRSVIARNVFSEDPQLYKFL